ncbi:hypothetical protein SALWKB12_0633 [Snodgrassella communis]|uniref:Uncharacterized protein n=1 Tax=Snodgrassella communis TaxID=2946699 RepID=A0A836MRM1_9NEIS|nr:hypothetical protein SALWKB12_0633 [Snodgrassella communis]KDN15135.1 hypothetical protein SALWKB29_0761 [Snodgrassella communis]
MFSTPYNAPVGIPVGLVNGAKAWNARYKYDEPSTSNNVFCMLIPEMLI